MKNAKQETYNAKLEIEMKNQKQYRNNGVN